jgi:hypothetical protein
MLPKVEIKKVGIIIVALVAVAFIAYKAYQLHYANTVFCVSHQISCTINRLQVTAGELEKAGVAK